MQKLQTQGVHHITLVGADRQTSIDFWEGVLGMPFIFEQPNLDNAAESHIYFDPGDGRLITVFTREDRKPVQRRTPTDTAACITSPSTSRAPSSCRRSNGSKSAAIKHTGRARPDVHGRDLFRGSARSPDRALLLQVRAPAGYTHADVLFAAHNLRVAARRPRDHGSRISPTRSRVSSRRSTQEPVGGPIAEGPIPAQPRA